MCFPAEKLEKLWEAITVGKTTLDEPNTKANDARTVAKVPEGAAPAVGEGASVGVGSTAHVFHAEWRSGGDDRSVEGNKETVGCDGYPTPLHSVGRW